ncbi:hypothetical protein S1OALGB6SA_516 [Olavius algarvensis spirochete endosymbiont]|nr:hypothetical protein S1OALGB6SA_516 [Olavius algarvensis spirochete endosymbiont]
MSFRWTNWEGIMILRKQVALLIITVLQRRPKARNLDAHARERNLLYQSQEFFTREGYLTTCLKSKVWIV